MKRQKIDTAVVPDSESLRPEGIVSATGDDQGPTSSKARIYDGYGPQPSGRLYSDVTNPESCRLSYDKKVKTRDQKTHEIKMGT